MNSGKENRSFRHRTHGGECWWALLVLLVCGMAFTGFAAADDFEYDYALSDPFAATVIGTPTKKRASFNEFIVPEEMQLRIRPKKYIPSVFWYSEQLRFGVAMQDRPAPLAFLIAGTGSNHHAGNMSLLANAIYEAGAHVVTLPSPTHPNFIVAASRFSIPGRPAYDVADLFDVFERVAESLAEDHEITGYYMAGYSLGAFHAALVAAEDARRHQFDFEKVLVINPPLRLYDSTRRLDAMLREGVGDTGAKYEKFLNDFLKNLTAIYARADRVSLDSDFLYRIYDQQGADPKTLKALIGISFRLAGSSLVFSTDVMNRAGYIVPKDLELTPLSSLTDYSKVTSRIPFEEYITDLLIPLVQAHDPQSTTAGLLAEAELGTIEAFLRSAPNVALLHNADDIILGPGDIEWFRDVFGDRATIFPNGGHLGNLSHRAVVEKIVGFFRRTEGGA